MIAVTEAGIMPLAVWSLRRGVTVRVLPIAEPLWHGDDIAGAAGMIGILDEHIVHVPGWGDVPFLSTDHVRRLFADDEQLRGQVDWIASCIAASHAPRRVPTAERRRAARAAAEPIVNDAADTWSIAAAAQILSRDPAISLGRESLIDFLKDLGWVVRENGVVIPAAHAVDAGTLHHNRVWNPTTKVAYNQVRVTRAGLQILHDRLGGYAALALETHPTPALLEIP